RAARRPATGPHRLGELCLRLPADPPVRRTRPRQHRLLERVRPWQPLGRPRRSRPAHRRPALLLPDASLTGRRTMRMRRVVTGHDDTGKAVVVGDEDVQPTDPDFGPKWSIWAADAPGGVPDGGTRPDFAAPLSPRPGGFHLTVLTLPARFNPDSMFDTSDPVRAAEIAREQTASAVAVVPDPNPAASYGDRE